MDTSARSIRSPPAQGRFAGGKRRRKAPPTSSPSRARSWRFRKTAGAVAGGACYAMVVSPSHRTDVVEWERDRHGLQWTWSGPEQSRDVERSRRWPRSCGNLHDWSVALGERQGPRCAGPDPKSFEPNVWTDWLPDSRGQSGSEPLRKPRMHHPGAELPQTDLHQRRPGLDCHCVMNSQMFRLAKLKDAGPHPIPQGGGRTSRSLLLLLGLPNCETGPGGIEEDAEPAHAWNLLSFLDRGCAQ